MRAKGERINRHLDRKGGRIHSRHDRRYDKRHYQARSHRHYESRPRVAYRYHDSFDRYLGLAINQPGFSLGWVWYD
jgi:hypothetical protein